MLSAYQPRNCRRKKITAEVLREQPRATAFGTTTFGTHRGNCTRTDVSDKRIRCTRVVLRRRCTGGASSVPVYFSVGSGDTSATVTTGIPSRVISCSPFLSLSLSLIFLYSFSAETYNYSFELQRGRIRETRKQTRRVFARSLVFRGSPPERSWPSWYDARCPSS